MAPPVLGAVTQPRLGWNPRTFHAFPSDMAVVTKSRLRTSDIQATVHSIEAPGIRVNDIVILPDGPLHEMSTPQGLGPNATVAEHMDAVSRLPGAVRGFPFTVKRGETVIAVTAWQAVNCDAIDPNVRPVVELSSVIGLDATRTLRPGAQPGFFHWENEDGPLLCAEQPAG